MSVPLFKPSIKRKDMDSVLTCLVSDQIGPSTLQEELITLMAQRLECQGGLALRDYSRAVELALESLDLPHGASILISPLAPVVYLQAMIKLGLQPLYCQVNQDSALMDLPSMDKLKEKVQAAVVFHGLGLAQPMDIFEDWDIPILEDISQSLGALWQERPVGSFGDMVIMAMESHHIITSGGGTLLLYGPKYKDGILNRSEAYSRESYLPDMNASLALVQLSQLEEFLEKREKLGKIFRQSVQRSKHRMLRQPSGGKAVYFSLPVFLNSSTREVSLYARKKNVETTLAFAGSILEKIGDDSLCPQARMLSMRTLLFPLYPMMGNQNADRVSKVLASLP